MDLFEASEAALKRGRRLLVLRHRARQDLLLSHGVLESVELTELLPSGGAVGLTHVRLFAQERLLLDVALLNPDFRFRCG